MGKVEKIEQEVQALSPEGLAQFRAWFLKCDLAEKALRDHTTGKTKSL